MVDAGSTARSRGSKDMPHTTVMTPAEDARTVLINNISWGAIFAGVALALVIQLLLNLLGLGIGAATVDLVTGDMPTTTRFSTGAAIWWIVAGIVASFLGGHAAGRLSGRPKASTAGWHGLTSWAVTTIVVFLLLTSTVGALLGGAFGVLKNTIGGLGRTVVVAGATAAADRQDPFAAIEREIRERGDDPQARRDAAVSAMRALVTGDPANAQAARVRTADALARAQDISPDEARAQVVQYEQQYRQAVEFGKQQAVRAAEAAEAAASKGAMFGVAALLLGAIAGWLGGRLGAVDPTMTADAEIIPARRQT